MTTKRRADVLVVEQGLAPTRTRAQALILAGAILTAEGHRIDKPGELLVDTVELQRKGEPIPYVSRGGLKLAAALDHFALSVTGAVALDVGASTGGFTDCLLQRGAARVFAVDVGYGQLAWSLRQDPRVTCIERANVRELDAARIDEPCTVVVIDVSFISLELVAPAVLRLAAPGARWVCLVKPQFEVGRSGVGKGGIVRDETLRLAALERISAFFEVLGFCDVRSMDSPIVGAKGNREYLLTARAPANRA